MWFLQTVASLLGILSHCGGLTTVSWLTNLTNTSQISFPPWIQTNFLLNYPSDRAGHKQFSQRQLNEVSCLSYLVNVNQSDCSIKLFLGRSFIQHCNFSTLRISWRELSANEGREAVFLPKDKQAAAFGSGCVGSASPACCLRVPWDMKAFEGHDTGYSTDKTVHLWEVQFSR